MPKYSVIIPVYNAEKTLCRCVDSLLNQNYTDMELILVNDGSSDGSLDICNTYKNCDTRVQVIDKPNGGVSTARNAGLDAAVGEYILFVDSDDYVSEDYFRILDEVALSKHYDFLMFSHSVMDGMSIQSNARTPFSADCSEDSMTRFCRMLYTKEINSPCTKRYCRKIIEDHRIRFPENLYIGEDKCFNLQYALHCSSCLVSQEVLYYVSIENDQSLSRKMRPDLYQQFERLDAKIRQIIREADIPEHHRSQYEAAENLIQLRAIYSESKRMHLANRDRKFRRTTIRQMCQNNNAQKSSLPGGLFSKLLQIPVRLKLVTVIDLIGWCLTR